MRSKILASVLAIGLGLVTPIVSSIVFPDVVVGQTVEERKKEADRLLQLGIQQHKTSQFTAALLSWEQALAIYHSINDLYGKGNAIGNLGNAYHSLGDYSKAIDYHKQSLEISREFKDRRGEGNDLGNLGGDYYSLGNYTKAIEYHEQYLKIAREFKDYLGEGNALENLGLTYYSLGNYRKSIEYIEQSLAIARETKNRHGEGSALLTLGNTYLSLGKYSKAIEYHEQSLTIMREIKDRDREGSVLTNLGNTYYSLSNYGKAIEYHEQSLAIAHEINDYRGEGQALGNLGTTYLFLGEYSKAIEYQEQSLAIAQKIKDYQGEGSTLGNLGVTYYTLGNYSKAIKYYEKHLAITREIKDRRGEREALTNLGSAFLSQGTHIRAINYYEEGLAIAREIEDRFGEGVILGNIGSIYNSLENYSKAIEYYEQSLAIAREINNRHGEGSSLGNIGNIYNSLGKYSKAMEYYEKNLAIAREINDREEEGKSLHNLGVVLKNYRHLVRAEKILIQGINVWESLRLNLGSHDQNKVSIFEKQSDTYHLLEEVLSDQDKPMEALEISDRGRSRTLVELMSARLAREPIEKQKIENLSIAQIQNVAKTQNATLVQYSIVSKEELYIYITQPNGQVSFRKVDLTKLKQPIAELVNTGREAIGTRGRGDFTANIPENIRQEAQAKRDAQRDRNLRELHQLLIEPIADLLPKTETENVVFMPQGELFLVPFAALLDANNQPLITKHTILTSPSIQTLDLTHKTAQARPKGDRPSLVVGNPTMPSISTVIGDKPTQLKNLPGSETEANTIATQLNTIAITGANAKKDTVVKQMQTAGIIHLATHGLLDSFKGDTPGAIALAPNGTGDRNDGLLTSGEIFDLKLTADLVVLSACDTGRGDITGDGVIGLSRSLFVAGVPSVIVSLWKVPDESTSFLMTEFYKNWKQRNLNKAQALRQAMLTTRTKYPCPIDWAAFTLIGEAD